MSDPLPQRKVCVVITARPSYSRIRSTLAALRARADVELQLVVAASALLDQYGDVSKFIERDGYRINARVFMLIEGESNLTSAKTTGLGLVELSTVFDNLKPDVVVTIADRYETIATAIAAAYMNIPLAHVQGGEVTGSIDEKVRHAITKLADVHFVSTTLARERVIRMGELPERVHITGCPSIDIAAEVAARPALDFDPFVKYGGVGNELDLRDGYVVVMQHPVTTECGQARQQVEETLEACHALGMPVLWFWPNVDAGSNETSQAVRIFREQARAGRFHFFKNMGSADFLRLLINSRCLIGNSSVAIRECSFLGVPTVDIGSRQGGRERADNVIAVPHAREEILAAARHQVAHGRYPASTLYGDGQTGARIADLLATLTFSIEKKLPY